jgi:hypothetical protein
MERLTYNDPDRVVAGRDGNILESAAKGATGYNENNFIEIVEPQLKIPTENEQSEQEQEHEQQLEPERVDEVKVLVPEQVENAKVVVTEPVIAEKNIPTQSKAKETAPQVIQWAKFPKPMGENKKLGH